MTTTFTDKENERNWNLKNNASTKVVSNQLSRRQPFQALVPVGNLGEKQAQNRRIQPKRIAKSQSNCETNEDESQKPGKLTNDDELASSKLATFALTRQIATSSIGGVSMGPDMENNVLCDENMADIVPSSVQKKVHIQCHQKDINSFVPRQNIQTMTKDFSMTMDESFVSCQSVMDIDHDVSCPLDSPIAEAELSEDYKNRLQLYNLFNDDNAYLYALSCERQHLPKPGYMSKQMDITYTMRIILVDWLVEVQSEFNLKEETLFLAVNFVDRFLCYMAVSRSKLQLVGTTAMWIASKYEEIYPPDVNKFVYTTDNTYTTSNVLKMEKALLNTLKFRLSPYTSMWFLDLYLSKLSMNGSKVAHLASMFLELALVDISSLLGIRSSVVAAAALCLANITLDLEPWPVEAQKTTLFSGIFITPVVKSLREVHKNSFTLEQQAVRDKYREAGFSGVSDIAFAESIPSFEETLSVDCTLLHEKLPF